MWAALGLWLLGQSKDPRVRRAAGWLGLAAILLGGASAATGAVVLFRGARLSVGLIGGLVKTYSKAYNGTTYYSLAHLSMLGSIAKSIAAGQHAAAAKALDAWLLVADPLGIVSQQLEDGEVIEDDRLFREVPK